MAGDIIVDSPKVLPVIEILNSSYGHQRNSIKSFDISTTLRGIIDKQVGTRANRPLVVMSARNREQSRRAYSSPLPTRYPDEATAYFRIAG